MEWPSPPVNISLSDRPWGTPPPEIPSLRISPPTSPHTCLSDSPWGALGLASRMRRALLLP